MRVTVVLMLGAVTAKFSTYWKEYLKIDSDTTTQQQSNEGHSRTDVRGSDSKVLYILERISENRQHHNYTTAD